MRSIQTFLGDTRLETTAIYLHTDKKQLRNICELSALSSQPGVKAEEDRKQDPAGQA